MTLMLIADNDGALAVGGGGDVGGGGLQQDSELCGHQDSGAMEHHQDHHDC